MHDNEIQYSIVFPLYNEEMVVNETYKRLKAVIDFTNESYEIIFVNDGSKDRTVEIVREICKKDKNILGIFPLKGLRISVNS